MTPEIQGALSLALHHEQAAGAIHHWRADERLRKKHQSKAQKLRRRAEVLNRRVLPRTRDSGDSFGGLLK